MTRLSQTIGVERDLKQQVPDAIGRAQQIFAHPELYTGVAKTYQPFKEGDPAEQLPGDTHLVQYRVDELVSDVRGELVRLFDVTATKDYGNLDARADVKIDGTTLLAGVPAVYLLWLSGELERLERFIESFPILAPTERWDYDQESGVYKTPDVQTVRTRKEPRVVTKAEPTDKHPAQTEIFPEDRPVGTWTTVKSSGALRAPDVRRRLDRVRRLRQAVITALHEANTVQVTEQQFGEKLLEYVFE